MYAYAMNFAYKRSRSWKLWYRFQIHKLN